MRRTITHTFFTLLLTAGYLWGGCISCERLFARPASKGDCCKTRRCNQSGKPVDAANSQSAPEDCQTMPLERYQGASTQTEIGAVWFNGPAILRVDRFVPAFSLLMSVGAGAVWDSPPDLRILNASLLI